MRVPLWVRENSLVPMGPIEQAPFRSSFDDLTVHVYNLKTSAQFDLYDEGKTVHISAERHDNEIMIKTSEKKLVEITAEEIETTKTFY